MAADQKQLIQARRDGSLRSQHVKSGFRIEEGLNTLMSLVTTTTTTTRTKIFRGACATRFA